MSPAKSYEKAQPSLLEVGEGWQEEGELQQTALCKAFSSPISPAMEKG